ncbi:hypothetical protein [Streptomyces mirabilis]|uniref:hypothetical protein n=1 Tax=Streptomyces mirabilis TaxID=68239 RepID=UPI003669A139
MNASARCSALAFSGQWRTNWNGSQLCGELAQSADAEIAADLTRAEHAVLTGLLDRLAVRHGLSSAGTDPQMSVPPSGTSARPLTG